MKNAKALMVMGTASDVGKSVLVTALCRAFARTGVRVAPFKAQNMSNNAAVCDGGEIGRAQAVQAEACGLAPSVDMNPVLLKPDSDAACQVVIRGRASFRMQTSEYQRYRAAACPEVVASYRALAQQYELIVIEGAGGAAEINLRDRDIVNWAIAELAAAPVLLVGDIDKGGVFASLFGTVELLTAGERQRVRGFLINKFRGDLALLESGLRLLEQRTAIPVLGVLPYLSRLDIPQEDSAMLDGIPGRNRRPAAVTIGVIHFPRIANYTDFAPLENQPGVALHYMTDPLTAAKVDVVILPGTKSTVADLEWLRRAGWEDWLVRHRSNSGWIVGICGGYQMLGQRIVDPDRIESNRPEIVGLGLLEIETIFHPQKITARIEAVHLPSGLRVVGYEIHNGRIVRTSSGSEAFTIIQRNGAVTSESDGSCSADGRIIGTSIHGLFDQPGFRRAFVNGVRESKGVAPLNPAEADDVGTGLNAAIERLADVLEQHVDMQRIASLADIEWKPRNLRIGP